MKISREQAATFFEALWPEGVPEGSKLLLWRLPDMALEFIEAGVKSQEFANRVAAFAQNYNTYVGVCAIRADFEPGNGRERGKSSDAAFATGLTLDIDMIGPGRENKPGLFTTRSEAMALLERMPMKPSMIVSSGHGLQPWWIFREPLDLREPAGRLLFERIAEGWTRLAIRLANEMQRKGVDSVFDAARVMRVAGTLNVKDGANPVVAKIVENSDRRYNASDFEPFAEAGSKVEVESGLYLDKAAEPPFMKFMALCDAEPKFKASWEHKRGDLQDQSASGYDQSIADLCIFSNGGWTDQEIINTMVAWAVKHAAEYRTEIKELRYYIHTLKKAHKLYDQSPKGWAKEADKILGEVEAIGIDNPEAKSKLFAMIRKATGAAVTKVERTVDQHSYFVTLENGRRYPVDDVQSLKSIDTWSDLAYNIPTSKIPKEMPTPKIWKQIIAGLHPFIEQLTESEGLDARAVFVDHLREYGSDAKNLDGMKGSDPERLSVMKNTRPFIQAERLYLHGSSFNGWLSKQGIHLSLPVVEQRLKDLGFESRQYNYRDLKSRKLVGRRYWSGSLDGVLGVEEEAKGEPEGEEIALSLSRARDMGSTDSD